jgi:ABC-type sugar transport system permease subunit
MPAPVFGTMGVNPRGPDQRDHDAQPIAYKIAFERCDFGLASAVGTIWLVLLAAFAVIYVRLLAAQR